MYMDNMLNKLKSNQTQIKPPLYHKSAFQCFLSGPMSIFSTVLYGALKNT